MPRIAAAVGVFVLIAGSIAFNIFWYPIVWDSVGPSSHLPQSQQPEPAQEDSLATSDDWSKPSPTNATLSMSGSNNFYSSSSYDDSADDDSADSYNSSSSSYSGSYSAKSTSSTSTSPYKPSSYGSDSGGGYKYGSSGYESASTKANDYQSSETTEDDTDSSNHYGAWSVTPSAKAEPSSKYGSSYGYGKTTDESTSGRALVRVVRVTDSEEKTGQAADIRRLPKVDDDAPARNGYDSFAGSAPSYPTPGLD